MQQQHPEFERQAELEREMTSKGVESYKKALLKAQENGQESRVPAGLRMLKAAIEPTAKAIREFVEAANTGKAGRRHKAVKYLEGVDPETAAYLTARVILDKMSSSIMLQTLANRVGMAIEDEVRFRTFEQVAADGYKMTERSLEKTTNTRHRRRVLVFQMNRNGLAWEQWPVADTINLGVKLIELFVEATGLSEVVPSASSRLIVRGTAKTLEWFEKAHARHALLCPVYLPCVIPPKPWTSPLSGGYWTNAVRREPLVKTRSTGYIDELFNTEMPEVYAAINAVQATAWAVNRRVLEVADCMWKKELGLGSVLPSRVGAELPPKPAWLTPELKPGEMTEAQKAEFKEWKGATSEAHARNARSESRRHLTCSILQTAERFAPEKAIYFPHSMDFRGRIYSIPSFLSPQGGDLAKGLLHFAEGKPLGDEMAAGWLAIHGANTYGYDKASLEDRIAWVEANQGLILACARDPLSCNFWQDADSPWCFLAFCFEWLGFVEQGFDFVSRLAIALDGSCNGIQHYSAMLRDPVGGKAVNLIPSDKPSDIYGEVARVALDKLRLIASSGGDGADTAQRWIDFGVTRKITKRSVMVLPYGGTYMSCKEYVGEAVREAIETGAKDPWEGDRKAHNAALHFLAKHVWSSISDVVVKAKEAMAWLQGCARLAGKTGLPINWRTPTGFRVQQAYKEVDTVRIKTKIFGELVYLTLRPETTKIDAARQVTAIAPNFVHSMDASALQSCVNIATENGITSFAMIHDSYGTLAADTEMLGKCLRHAFVDLYSEHDVLSQFRAGIEEMLDDAARKKLAPVPASGDLDLSQVLRSDFFFA
jgi:DNA-directed RNA polymerase